MFRTSFQRPSLLAAVSALALVAAAPASAADLQFVFSQGGFTDGAVLSGTFSGQDNVIVDGYLSFDEVTDFSVTFSGNSLKGAFTLGKPALVDLQYELAGGAILGDDLNGFETLTFDGGGDLFGTSFFGVYIDIDRGFDGSNESILVSAVNAVPEPSTYALMALGLAGLVGAARRRR